MEMMVYIQEKVDPRVLVENLRSTAGRPEDEPELTLFDTFDGLGELAALHQPPQVGHRAEDPVTRPPGSESAIVAGLSNRGQSEEAGDGEEPLTRRLPGADR